MRLNLIKYCLLFAVSLSYGQVGINTDRPDPATVLDINSSLGNGEYGGMHIGVIQESDKADITLTPEDDGTLIYVDKGNDERCLEIYSAAAGSWGTVFCLSNRTDIIISEYVEGSSNNKLIELYNPTNRTVNLDQYRLVILRNGGDFPISSSDEDIQLVGSIASTETFIIANSSQTVYSGPVDQQVSRLRFNFNGNDPVALVDQSGNVIDIIGIPGTDPGDGYPVDNENTQDNTIRRNASINMPNSTWTPAEWSAFPTDNVRGLGAR